MRVGSIDEHALLMASMFRAVKFENMDDIETKFMHKKLHAELKAKQTLHGELSNNQNIDQLINDLNGAYDKYQTCIHIFLIQKSADGGSTAANTTVDKNKDQSKRDKDLRINKDKNIPIDSKLLQQASVQAAMNEGKKKRSKEDKKQAQMEDESSGVGSINDRVFVCLGKLKDTGQPHSWVMTLNRTYDEVIRLYLYTFLVTLWDVNLPHKYVNLKVISLLHGRIVEGEEKNLQGYLSPFISEQEKKQIDKLRQLQRQESEYQIELNKSLNQSKRLHKQRRDQNGAIIDDGSDGNDEDNKDADFLSSQQSREVTDDEKESDSDFMDQMDKLVYFEDLDQRYKGGDINLVGKLKALSREKQQQLKELDYQSDADQEDEDRVIQAKKPVSKFLEKQQQERIEREKKRIDKHINQMKMNLIFICWNIWPVESFYDKRTGKNAEKVGIPYSQIDLIFNHKNIWANLQNPNPAQIYYHLHNESQWLPLITDLERKHPLILQEEMELRRQLEEEMKQQHPANQQQDQEEEDEIVGKKKTKKENEEGQLKTKTSLLEYKLRGDFMKPFLSFYDPKALEQPFSQTQIEKYEKIILKDMEVSLKQVRSSLNLSTKLRKNALVNQILLQQLDFLEDLCCERLNKEQIQVTRVKISQELVKLIPEGYKIQLLPAFFNYTDAERIKSVLAEQAKDFIQKTPKKVMFAAAVKIYPFHNQITSVRIIIAKMAMLDEQQVARQQQIQMPQQNLLQLKPDDNLKRAGGPAGSKEGSLPQKQQNNKIMKNRI